MNISDVKKKIDLAWDELCRHKPTIVQNPKALKYSFVDENKAVLLMLSIKELKLMGRDVYSHFLKKEINAEVAMGDIGLWAYRDA